MTIPAPLIDTRTAGDVAAQAKTLVQTYAPGYDGDDPTGGALIGIFGRLSELIIQRLNRVPDKNFLAFLDLLGASQLPPQPARVPLTFSLAAGSLVSAVVPAGTQAAAPPDKGEKDPIIFETEQELVVSPALLTSVFCREPDADAYADLRVLTTPTAGVDGVAIFHGDQPIEHVVYLGFRTLLGLAGITSFRVTVGLLADHAEPRAVVWEAWTGSAWTPLFVTPGADATFGLQVSGTLALGALEALPLTVVQGVESRWLRGRLTTPINIATAPRPGTVRTTELPSVRTISASVTVARADLNVDSAFTNTSPLDATKDFFPFGETPRFGDVCYLRLDEPFSVGGAAVALRVTLTNPSDAGTNTTPPPTTPSTDLKLSWELWNGSAWIVLGTSAPGAPPAGAFPDGTRAFTRSGTVSFAIPATPAATVVNGIAGYWLRVRIIGGDYGHDARYVSDGAGGFTLEPATFKPPVIKHIATDYTLATSATPDAVLTGNDFTAADVSSQHDAPGVSFSPFVPMVDTEPTLYLGFELPPGLRVFPNRPMSLFARTADIHYGDPAFAPASVSASDGEPVRLAWESWNGAQWAPLAVEDGTDSFTRSDTVEFLAPPDLAQRPDFALPPRYWIRVRLDAGTYTIPPRLMRILPNTTLAGQTITIRGESLGSSDGSKRQRFKTTRAPVLPGQQLQVREPELPSAAERAVLMTEEGATAIITTLDAQSRPTNIWVRWHEVADFYASGPRDRHYVVDRLSGEIRFGDGLNGLVPPTGIGNVRMAVYQTGGGSTGNRPAGTIVQLKTTVPYIDKVINTEPAAGGTDAESIDRLVDRAPRSVRHGGRAVTLEDYEDLAQLASPEVARAKCVPLVNLLTDPLSALPAVPGEVSVIIVPRSDAAKPVPSLELIRRVQEALDAAHAPTASLSIVGPLFVRVDVSAEVALVSLQGAANVLAEIERRVAGFLHPLTGGRDGAGWDFGRRPHESDFHALIETVDGVDHVRTLDVAEVEDLPGITATGRFLVYAGRPDISIVFEEA
jgi:hypothetical protein